MTKIPRRVIDDMTPKKSSKKRSTKAKAPDRIFDRDVLSLQQLAFVNHYIVCMNGTEAARLAKYSGDDRTLAVTASELLRNGKVIREIDRRLSEYTMTANEVLIHITDIARSDLGDALDAFGGVDPLEAKRRGKSHLIKRFKVKTITTTDEKGVETETIETEIEMYSRIDALTLLAKYHDLVNRIKVEDWRTEIIALIQSGKVTPQQVTQELGESLATELFETIHLSGNTG